jgi:hypothetical protein
VRKCPELEVLVDVGELVEPEQRFVQRASLVNAVQPERRDRLQGDRADDAESTEADARGVPSAVTTSSETTCVARLPRRAPVPWVAVEMAPATLWTLMSPRLAIARPISSSRLLSWNSRVPAATVAWPLTSS